MDAISKNIHFLLIFRRLYEGPKTLEEAGVQDMTNEALNDLLEQGLKGCGDRQVNKDKCAHCIYNISKQGIDYSIFHDMD